jgi:hypothetical protein
VGPFEDALKTIAKTRERAISPSVGALIALRDQKGGKPLAYLDWAPKRQATFFSARCAT